MESKIYPVEHSYFELKRLIAGLIARYPFINLSNLGRSAAGRDIPALTIGSGNEYVAFVGGDDPACRISTLLLLAFTEELCSTILHGAELCGMNMRKALFGRGIILIPTLNPDGAEIALRGEMGCGYMSGKILKMCGGDFSKWHANLRGVELVRNFSYDFETRRQQEKQAHVTAPMPAGFSGYKAETEPEVLALTELCRSQNIRHLISLSAYGETVSYSGVPTVPEHSAKMAEVMAAVSSFTICPPVGKAQPELNDWFTYEFLRPGLCVRVGRESIPPVTQLQYWYGRIRELLTLSALF